MLLKKLCQALRRLTDQFFIGMGLIALLSSCQSAQIPNVQFTGSLGPSGAVQFDLLDSKTNDMTLSQFAAYWNDLKNPKGPPVCMRTQDWASLKMALEQLCSWVQGGCSYEQKQALQNFTNQINKIK